MLNRFKNIFLFEKLYDKMEKEIEEKKDTKYIKRGVFRCKQSSWMNF